MSKRSYWPAMANRDMHRTAVRLDPLASPEWSLASQRTRAAPCQAAESSHLEASGTQCARGQDAALHNHLVAPGMRWTY